MVISVDGKSTKNSLPPREWTSKEDKEYLRKLINSQRLILMGRKTYQAAKPIIKLTPKTLRIVLTKNPKKFEKETVAGQLQFTSFSPPGLVKQLEHLGYKKMLLIGGSELNISFFKAKLIDELWLTIEPKIFGKGLGLVGEKVLNIDLKLISVSKLNKNGTLLLKYRVIG